MTKVLETGFMVWAISLGVMMVVGIAYAVLQVVAGNSVTFVI